MSSLADRKYEALEKGSRIFFPAFFIVGLLFDLFFLGTSHPISRLWRWADVIGNVSAVSVQRDPVSDYRIDVEFSYEFKGQSHHVTQPVLVTASSDYSNLAAIKNAYPLGSPVHCLVDPVHPDQAILRPNRLLFFFLLSIPTVMMLVGAVGICATLNRPTESALNPPDPKIVNPALLGCGLVMAGVCATLSYQRFFQPLFRATIAQKWVETPCVIESSEIIYKNTIISSSVDIRFSYQMNGQTFHSDQYAFGGSPISVLSPAKTIPQSLRPGSKAVCYVNPADPNDAVIERRIQSNLHLWDFSLSGLVIGLTCIAYSRRRKT